MKDELNKTLNLLLEQKNSIINEINKSEDIELKNKLFKTLYDLNDNIKLYYKDIDTFKEIKSKSYILFILTLVIKNQKMKLN